MVNLPHLVVDDVESKDADGVDVLLVAAGPEAPVVAEGFEKTHNS